MVIREVFRFVSFVGIFGAGLWLASHETSETLGAMVIGWSAGWALAQPREVIDDAE